MYCFKNLTKINRSKDHIFPRGWRIDSDSGSYEAWTVPACKKCNSGFSGIENDFMPRMAMCIDDSDAYMAPIRFKGLRHCHPLLSKDRESYQRKSASFDKIFSDMFRFEDVAKEEIVLNPYGGDRSTKVIKFPGEWTRTMVKKWACSLEYKMRSNYLGRSRCVDFWVYGIQDSVKKDIKTVKIDSFLSKEGTRVNQSKAFIVTYIYNKKYKDQVLYRINLWRTYQYYFLLRKRKKDDLTVNQIRVSS